MVKKDFWQVMFCFTLFHSLLVSSLFEGGLTLKITEIKNAGPVITKLITIGSAVTFFWSRHVVLIDSDENNIKRAKELGIEAFMANIYSDALADNIELNDVGYLM